MADTASEKRASSTVTRLDKYADDASQMVNKASTRHRTPVKSGQARASGVRSSPSGGPFDTGYPRMVHRGRVGARRMTIAPHADIERGTVLVMSDESLTKFMFAPLLTTQR
jgi:hypothetical protein